MYYKKRTLLIAAVLSIPLFMVAISLFFSEDKPDPRGEMYAGSETCKKCHAVLSEHYMQNAHFKTSAPVNPASLMFNPDQKQLDYDYGNFQQVRFEKRGKDFFQVGYSNGTEQTSAAMDLVIGTKNAQTYLTWRGDFLFELPATYFKNLNRFTASPGYLEAHPDFNRGIVKRCLQCHTSFIDGKAQENHSFSRNVRLEKASLITGIDCERCHGPSANHVNFHTAYPDSLKSRYMKSYLSLTRTQKIDACAMCHSGSTAMMVKNIYFFKPGDTLENYREVDYMRPDPKVQQDVHGNQVELLAGSKCFISSQLECGTCHDTHQNKLSLTIYNQKCQSCHYDAGKKHPSLTEKEFMLSKNKCVDCHMPMQSSNTIKVKDKNKLIHPYQVRTHLIRIYPEETKKIIQMIKNLKK
ncbi:multiheme c-type cytochrome [Pedobacter metabolipauper]|uniref:Cytochrome c554/c'-like protein n=1 Tax=Pedobacter metabolipauper TaxID=425513 RepID=A0A4R6T1L9_9SPHI|nr:multiheme c-type cytochrome [Pedobacter metabolipauper]TDQ11548.1 cytochrome c554/c'-like protein [Pedobacter metabolipauper]